MKTNSIIIFRTYKMNARNKMSVLNNDDNKLIRFLMGNQVEKDFTFYSLEEHPIEGRVTVYSIQGEGAYVMSKLTELTAGTEILIRKIAAEENPFLVKFYNFEKNVGPVVKCSQQCSETTKNICISYW
jgi:altronate dehydratase